MRKHASRSGGVRGSPSGISRWLGVLVAIVPHLGVLLAGLSPLSPLSPCRQGWLRAHGSGLVVRLSDFKNDSCLRPLHKGWRWFWLENQAVATVATVATVASSQRLETAANDPAHNLQKPEAEHQPATLAQATVPEAAAQTRPPPAPPAYDPGHAALLALAMAYCDRTGASDKARRDWQRDIADTPSELRADLYQHLRACLPPAPRPASSLRRRSSVYIKCPPVRAARRPARAG